MVIIVNNRQMKNILIKYILYIKQIEGTDYVTTHNESHICDVPFTEEEWRTLFELCQLIDIEQRETAKGKPTPPEIRVLKEGQYSKR